MFINIFKDAYIYFMIQIIKREDAKDHAIYIKLYNNLKIKY